MKKNILIYFFVVALVIGIGLILDYAVATDDKELIQQEKEESSKEIKESVYLVNSKGKVVKKATNETIFLKVNRNNLTLKGEASEDIYIILSDRVKNLTIEELDQGEYEISIETSLKWETELVFKGNNHIYTLDGFEGLHIHGEEKNDKLIADYYIGSLYELKITSGIIETEWMYGDDVVLSGNPQIYIKEIISDDAPRLDVYESLKVDFAEGGILHIDESNKCNEIPAFIDKIELGTNTKITVPSEGYLKYVPKLKEGLYYESVIVTESGEVAKEVTIEYAE